MGKWFFTADTHFGHANIIKYCKRPFLSKDQYDFCDLIKNGVASSKDLKIDVSTVAKMDQTITRSINSVVGKNDNLVIIGDFTCDDDKEAIKDYRKRIECKNVFLILGNHDNIKSCEGIFTACYQNYLFNINGQKIFTSHYPCRSWAKASGGSWMLYGHVHNEFYNSDNGKLSKYETKVFNEGFESVLTRHDIKSDKIIEELIAVVESVKGIDLTLDVGVDNIRENVPFGTPWSFEEIDAYMGNKKIAWAARKAMNRLL